MYRYFISYFYTDDNDKIGVGNCELGFKKEIQGYEDIVEIQEKINERLKESNCSNPKSTINNFILLK